MKQRIFSILLALCLVLSLLPTITFAEGETTAEVGTAAELRSAIEGGTADTVKLTADITIDARLTVTRTVAVDLNGCVLSFDQTADSDSIFRVSGENNTLTLRDSRPDATHSDDALPVGGLITGGRGNTYFTGSYIQHWGGGIYLDSAAFVLEGGTIYDCGFHGDTSQSVALFGGGIYSVGSSVKIHGGAIRSCVLKGDIAGLGGGIHLDRESSFEMTDGVIADCAASGAGGGIYSNCKAFQITGGRIENCTAGTKGGGIFLGGYPSPAVLNATISGCTAKYGGGVYLEAYAALELQENALITGCKLTDDEDAAGEAIYFSTESVYTANTDGIFLYANGGKVEGTVYVSEADWDFGKNVKFAKAITHTDDAPTTVFTGDIYCKGDIRGGIFYGKVTVPETSWNWSEDYDSCISTISGGTFYGPVETDCYVSGGMYYAGLTFGEHGERRDGTVVVTNRSFGETYCIEIALRGYRLSEPDTPEREGYTFLGWYSNRNRADFYAGTYIDKTHVARWQKNTADIAVTADKGGKVSADGTTWSGSITVSVPNGKTLGESLQFQPDDGYELVSAEMPKIVDVAAAGTYTVLLDENGHVWTVGDNFYGQLGQPQSSGGKYPNSALQRVTAGIGDTRITAIAAGPDYAFLLDENGRLWSAGRNRFGQLGRSENVGSDEGATQKFERVTDGLGDTKIVSVSAGDGFAFAIDENGHLWSAGRNQFGQLGYDENAHTETPNPVFRRVTDGVGNTKFAAVSAGMNGSLALDETGCVWSVGYNAFGQLGYSGGDENRCLHTFQKVTAGIGGVRIVSIAVGGNYAYAIDEDGHVWSAGINDYGLLGRPDNYETAKANPTCTRITDGIGDTKIVAASAQNSYATLLDEDGGIWTLGKNDAGQLGREDGFGSDSATGSTFRLVSRFSEAKIVAIATAEKPAVGFYDPEEHTVALDADGKVWTNGKNSYGQRGCYEYAYWDGDWHYAPLTTSVGRNLTAEELDAYVPNADTSLHITFKDVAAPVIDLEDGKTYCGAVTATVTDNDEIEAVTLNGKPATLGEGGKLTLAPADGEQTLTVTDKTGNATTVTVTVNAGHTYSCYAGADGLHYQHCAVCGNDVDCDYTTKVVPATCTASGYTVHTCVNCGNSYIDTLVVGGHDWVKTVTPPTHTEMGYTYYECSVCKENYKSDYTAPVGHTFDDGTVAKEATCTEEGKIIYACSCGATHTAPIPKTGHELVDTVTAPTCTELGYTTHSCKHCDYTYTDTPVAALGHKWDNGTVTKEATCTADGEMTYACFCGATRTAPIPKTGHELVATVTAPTCTELGFTTHTCKHCDYTYTDTPVAALGHKWDGGKVAAAPSLTETGKLIQTCTVCKATKESVIPMLSDCDGGEGCPSSAYKDVPGLENWAHVGIDFVLKSGLFYGTSDATFSPDDAMTRAMLVTVLYRLEGQPKVSAKNPFSDVESDTWYTDAVIWAVENKIVNGIGGGKFDPDGKITREQMAAILYRYSTFKGLTLTEGKFAAEYPDEKDISAYALDAMRWANAETLINGTGIGSTVYLDPQGNATRAQVAAILMRYVQNILSK